MEYGLFPGLIQPRFELVDGLCRYHCSWQGVPVIDDSCTEWISEDKLLSPQFLELPCVAPCPS